MAEASFTLKAVDSTKQAFASVQNNLERLKTTAAVAGKSLTRSLDVRGAMTSVAVAVGLSVNSISEKIARLISGTSAEQEALTREGIALQEQVGALRARNAEDQMSDELILAKLERDRSLFESKITTDKNQAQGTEGYNEALRNQIALEETIKKLTDFKAANQAKLTAENEVYQKSLEDLGRAQAAIYSGEALSLGERISALRAQESAIMGKIATADMSDLKKRTELNNELVLVLQKIAPLLDEQGRLSMEAGNLIAQGFEDAILSGQKLGEVVRSLGRDLVRLVFSQLVTQPLAAGIGGAIKSAFLPGRAMGGPVASGSPYVVGEKGPELFVPHASGTIVPNNKMGGGSGSGGGSVTVNYNIAAGVSRAELVPILDQERRRLKAEIPDMVRRGGGYRAAFA
jgi:hypothetical protein